MSNANAQDDAVRPAQTSLLFERYAYLVVAAVLAAAIWFRITAVIVLAASLLAMNFMIKVWKKKSLDQVMPSLKLARTSVFAGDKIKLEASLLNNKWLPLVWLEWELPQWPGIRWGDEGGTEYRDRYCIRFLWLLWFQKVEWEISGLAAQRGVYRVGEITLRSGDGFRFSELEKKHSLPDLLYVYPKLLPVQPPNLPSSLRWNMSGVNGGYLEDPQLIQGMREYQSGDDFRRISWQASARTGVMQTRIHQPVRMRQMIFYIDVTGFSGPDREEDFEWFLSVIASLALRYRQQGIMAGWASNALDFAGRRIGFVKPNGELTRFMDVLARITPRVGSRGLNDLGFALKQASAPVFYFCDQLDEEYIRLLAANPEISVFLFTYYMKENHTPALMTGSAKLSAKRIDSLLAKHEGVSS